MGVALRGCSTNRHAPRAASVRYTGVKQHQQSYLTCCFFMFFMLVDIFLRFMWVDESPHKNEIYMRARARDPEERNDKTGCTAFIRTLTPVTLSEISLVVLARNVHRVGHRRAPCTGCTSSDGYYGSALLYTGGGAVSADVGPRNPSVVVDAAEAARPQAARPAWRRHHLIAD